MSLQDQTLTCRDCGQSFTFSAGEQAFYAERNLHTPTRCPACRAKRRQGAGNSQPTPNRGRAPRQQRQLYPAVCDECGEETMVPFMPRGDRPVYCEACYREIRGR
ncbi:MAG: zinc-ribbon domain containing protein [Anaerolineae bacterium]